MMEQMGRGLMILGLIAVVGGALLWLASRMNLPLGRLPGDFRIETGNVTCIFPLATMIILSIFLTILLNVIVRLLNR